MSFTRKNRSLRLAALLGSVLVLGGFAAQAEVPVPDVPKARAGVEHCVEDTDVMRKQHYSFMLHQRDETTYGGIRTSKHSLKACISCHVQPRADGSFPSHDEPDHFCSSCHNYAAVKVDCFDCHADKDPEGASGK